MSADIDLDQLDYFLSEIGKVNEPYMKKRIRKFLLVEGTQLKKETLRIAKARVKKHTGNYHKGIKRGKVYLYKGETWAIRAYNSMPHAHLVEEPHRIVTKDGREIGMSKGKKVFKTAERGFSEKYLQDVDSFVDTILEEGLGF